MHLAVIGAGYVGLVSAACFADFGHDVACIDIDAGRVARLAAGEVPIYEPGLAELSARNVAAGRLHFTTDLRGGVAAADAVFIAVGTPSRRGDGAADLTYVYAAARDIAAALRGFTVVVTKSTVPVGTGDEVERVIRAARPDADFAVASNPEFLREGAAIDDFKRPDRIIVGIDDERACAVMSEIYRPLYLNAAPLIFTSRRTAELTKYAANAFLAAKITFINEMADLCERVGADVQDVARGIGLDRRIGPKFLHAGPGFGGSCFPKDLRALAETARAAGAPSRLIESVVAVNDERKNAMAERVVDACGGSVAGRTVAVLGLSFKPNTDDLREAPSLPLIAGLQTGGATVRAFDPVANDAARALLPAVAFASDVYDCAAGADVLVIVTEWEIFRALDMGRLKAAMRAPILVDLRNIYRPDDIVRAGFVYRGIGRGAHDDGSAAALAAQ